VQWRRGSSTACGRYALANQALILFRCRLRAFIRDPDMPISIYEIEGAKAMLHSSFRFLFEERRLSRAPAARSRVVHGA